MSSRKSQESLWSPPQLFSFASTAQERTQAATCHPHPSKDVSFPPRDRAQAPPGTLPLHLGTPVLTKCAGRAV